MRVGSLSAIIVFVLAMTMTMSTVARSQTKSSPRVCDKVSEPWLKAAVAEGQKLLSQSWLVVGSHYYAAYDVKTAPANPFDIEARKAAAAGAEQIRGYLWASDLRCTIGNAEPDQRIELNFEAAALSFHENGLAWTKPFRAKLLLIVVARVGSTWVASDERGEYSVLMPELKIRRPAPEEIPPTNAKLRIPCKAEQVWNGRRCAADLSSRRPGR